MQFHYCVVANKKKCPSNVTSCAHIQHTTCLNIHCMIFPLANLQLGIYVCVCGTLYVNYTQKWKSTWEKAFFFPRCFSRLNAKPAMFAEQLNWVYFGVNNKNRGVNIDSCVILYVPVPAIGLLEYSLCSKLSPCPSFRSTFSNWKMRKHSPLLI